MYGAIWQGMAACGGLLRPRDLAQLNGLLEPGVNTASMRTLHCLYRDKAGQLRELDVSLEAARGQAPDTVSCDGQPLVRVIADGRLFVQATASGEQSQVR